MIVRELFEHFADYFSQIRYTDKTNKIDEFELFSNLYERKSQYDNFKKKYGNFIVNDWKMDNGINAIWITISEE